jgi:ABC-type Zn uptake system ZnuABC Zn-binding protein ZnuA
MILILDNLRPRERLLVRLASTVVVLTLLFAAAEGCGSDDDESGQSRPNVAATTGIWADVTEQVAGDDATVEQVIPDASSPHEFQLSAEDRAKIEDSLLLVYNGADLEAGIPIDEIDVPKFAVADHAGELLPFEEAGEHAEEEQAAEGEHAATEAHATEGEYPAEEEHAGEEEHEHGGLDPHVWMDPSRVAAALPALADALAEADPDHADGYRSRAERYAAELRALDAEVERAVAAIPPQNRKLVTSHDAMGYFADRYGLEVLATPFPASGPEAEPSAETIKEVEDAIRSSGVPTVFAQETDDPEVLERIADETGVGIEENLLVEAPGEAGSYAEMLREDAELLRNGLAGAVPVPG